MSLSNGRARRYLFIACSFALTTSCCSASEYAQLRPKLVSLRNTWDANREHKRIVIDELSSRDIADPPIALEMIPSAAVVSLELDSSHFASWAKSLFDVILQKDLDSINERPSQYLCSITVLAPWGGRLLQIGISKDLEFWVIDGTSFKATPEMEDWLKKRLLPLFTTIGHESVINSP
jgi:hypothetical protein